MHDRPYKVMLKEGRFRVLQPGETGDAAEVLVSEHETFEQAQAAVRRYERFGLGLGL
jgi:hypothetical protein